MQVVRLRRGRWGRKWGDGGLATWAPPVRKERARQVLAPFRTKRSRAQTQALTLPPCGWKADQTAPRSLSEAEAGPLLETPWCSVTAVLPHSMGTQDRQPPLRKTGSACSSGTSDGKRNEDMGYEGQGHKVMSVGVLGGDTHPPTPLGLVQNQRSSNCT